jgi:hypothetical protein
MDLIEARTERNEAIKRAEAAEAELVRQQAFWAEVEMERDTLRGRADRCGCAGGRAAHASSGA